MTDTEIDERIAVLQETIEWLRAQKRSRQVESRAVDPMSDLMTPGAAVNLSGLSRATIHRLCVENQIDGNDNGNGIALWSEEEGRYQISRSRLLALLALRNGR
jgi:hypothetical protein